MAKPITEQDRTKVRDALTHFITKIEIHRGQQPDEQRIRKSVTAWEEKCFLSCNELRADYVEKYNTKRQTLEAELKKNAPQAGVPSAAAAQQQQRQSMPTQPQPQSQQMRPIPRPLLPQPQLSQQQQAPPKPMPPHPQQPQMRTSPAPSNAHSNLQHQQQHAAAVDPHTHQQVSNLTKEFLENVREPLDQCRTILRILSTVFQDKSDGALKQEFVDVFQRTTDLLKKKLPLTDLRVQTQAVSGEVFQLRAKLEPRVQKVSDYLKLSYSEMVEIESQPFGLLQRTVEIHGTQRFAVKAKRISSNVGGRVCLKMAKFDELQ
ncbi:hypothetical protein BASA81_006491 [Batrachochytrium salamandrivorans]|nr:hypothetical protein BASA81_006491 [Batrachochytrium salamandrivorans]